MLEEKNNIESSSPSPVVCFSKNKIWQSKMIMLLLGLIIIGGMMSQHFFKRKDNQIEEETSTSTFNATAPQLAPLDQQLAQVTEAIEKQPEMQDKENYQNYQMEEEAAKLEKMRMVAPTTMYSATGGVARNAISAESVSSSNAVLGGSGAGEANSQFMSHVSSTQAPLIQATHIVHPAATLAQGTMIWATLETRLVSDLPGMTRGITSENIYSEDGSQILLPKGSKLIGQYTNTVAQGQQRVFVVWQRVIRPDHISIQLNSPGTDSLGAAGISADAIDKHFFEQFGTAALLSIISAGAANSGVSSQDQFNSASAYREAISNSFAQTAENTLRAKGIINPTLYIDQGKAISVYVARDLDFYNELHRGDISL